MGNGKQMRFHHIDDCVMGVIKTMDKIENGEAINLSTGKYTSFIEFLKISRDIIGNDFKIVTKKSKPVGVFARGGCTKKQRKLGFKYQVDLKLGIDRGINYLSKIIN